MNWTTSAVISLHKFIVITMLLGCSIAFGQIQLLSPQAKVSVITCATGNESYSLFGHTALRISDPSQSLDVVYNYGAFDFSTPNFVAKFAKGDLQYFVVVHTYTDFINQYQYEGRSVFEQQLTLSLELKQKLFDRLSQTLQSEERFYTYKFIDQNCTTMVVDLLNNVVGSPIIRLKIPHQSTYRNILFPYFSNHFFEQLGTSIIFGTKVDQKATTVFLPFQLLETLKSVRYQNKPLASPVVSLLTIPPTKQESWWNTIYMYGILLTLLLVWKKNSITLFFLATMGVLGLFFLFMGFYSLHQELVNNYNMLLFNPTLLLLVLLWICNQHKAVRFLIFFNWICFILYTILIVNKSYFLIIIPLVGTTSWLVYRLYQSLPKFAL